MLTNTLIKQKQRMSNLTFLHKSVKLSCIAPQKSCIIQKIKKSYNAKKFFLKKTQHFRSLKKIWHYKFF